MFPWFFLIGSLLTLSAVFIYSFAIIFSYQKRSCLYDSRFLCWADWRCGDPKGTIPVPPTPPASTGPLYVLDQYFGAYAKNCLNGAPCTACDTLGYDPNAPTITDPYTGKDGLQVYDPAKENVQNICKGYWWQAT